MGNEYCHIYKHDLRLTPVQQKGIEVILTALEKWFQVKSKNCNISVFRFGIGKCNQKEGACVEAFVIKLWPMSGQFWLLSTLKMPKSLLT